MQPEAATDLSQLNRVLVVDDSRVARRIVVQALLAGGIARDAVAEAANGAEALDSVEELVPDLVLSDVNMPVLDGAGLLDELSKRGHLPALPVVMITSTATARNRLSLRRRGARAVVAKPFEPELLFQRIRSVLGGDESEGAAVPASEPPMASTNDPLRDAVARCLERMAFFDVEHAHAEAHPDQVLYIASIPFAAGGYDLQVACHAQLASELHGRLIGEETELTDRSRCEAVSELCNVVAGDWVHFSGLHGENTKFGLPSWSVFPPGETLLDATTFVLDGADPLFAHICPHASGAGS